VIAQKRGCANILHVCKVKGKRRAISGNRDQRREDENKKREAEKFNKVPQGGRRGGLKSDLADMIVCPREGTDNVSDELLIDGSKAQ